MDVQKKNGTREEGKLCPPLEFNGYNRKNGAMEQRKLCPPLDNGCKRKNENGRRKLCPPLDTVKDRFNRTIILIFLKEVKNIRPFEDNFQVSWAGKNQL